MCLHVCNGMTSHVLLIDNIVLLRVTLSARHLSQIAHLTILVFLDRFIIQRLNCLALAAAANEVATAKSSAAAMSAASS